MTWLYFRIIYGYGSEQMPTPLLETSPSDDSGFSTGSAQYRQATLENEEFLGASDLSMDYMTAPNVRLPYAISVLL